MKSFILTMFLYVGVLNAQGNLGCLEADILLVADLSGSINGNEDFVADAYVAFINRFELADHRMRIGAYAFSKNVHLISHLTSDKAALLSAVEVMRKNPYGTSTNLTSAMLHAGGEYVSNWRREIRRILILISDGHADNRATFLASVAQLKQELGVEVCGIYVDTYEGKPKDMLSISEPYCYVASNYEQLVEILERLNICG